MDGVHAFVGHSFTTEDEDVVRAFTDYLDTVKHAVPSFTWTHARMPEPRLVDEKVLSLFEGKNVFIAICTRKELVIKPNKVAMFRFGLFRDEYWAKQSEFEYKTSDWIIQEIGLAIGRGMRIILLLETGVREPGALQGNLERIPFSRDDPSKAFGPLLGMISSLASRASPATVGASEERPQPTAKADAADEVLSAAAQTGLETQEVPKTSWTKNEYEMAMVNAIGDETKVVELDRAYRSSPHAGSREDTDFWEAWKQFLLFVFRKGGDLDELRKIAGRATGDRAAETVALLGKVYGLLQEHRRAAAEYERAATLSASAEDQASQLSSAASAYMKAGESSAADAAIATIRRLAAKGEAVVPTLLEAEAARAKALEGDKSLYFGAMEAALEHDPTSHDLRFDLAYEYAQHDQHELALFHYSRISFSSRTPSDWNNLGVALEKLEIAARSINAYQTAADAGNTLATANLAYRLMEIGFLDDAEKLLLRALAEKDHHPNVEKALARAKEIPEEAKNLEEEALKKAGEVSSFYRECGKALVAALPSITGRWKGPKCDLTMSVQGSVFTAYGEYEQKLGLISAAMGFNPKPEQRFQKFTGTMRGAFWSGKLTSGRVGEEAGVTSLLLADTPTSFIAYVGEDDAAIEVMELTSSGANAKRYKLTRTVPL